MRRRVLFLIVAAMISSGIGYLVANAVGGGSSLVTKLGPNDPIELQPTAIGPVLFGASESVAVARLVGLFGKSEGPAQRLNEGGCGTYDLVSWKDIQVFFMTGRLVGYSTGYTRSRNVSTFTTARGLRIGDTIAAAQRLYGTAFATSSAQGGSWSVITAAGSLIGYLTDPPVPTGPSDRIAGIAAGYVGCPAMTP